MMENRKIYLSFVVPCYNSQNYMARCIESLLPGGEDVEIIIIDDGSKDRTGAIADEYQEKYPDIVKVIHKENGGHGSGVNAGLACAKGIYFKVVDSDDWLKGDAYRKLLEKIRYYCKEEKTCKEMPDLFVCNYVYNHLEEQVTRSMGYKNVFPVEKICHWSEIGHFLPSQYLVMHALIYRTEVLRQSGIVLPEHTFYVDNLFAYCPLPYVRNIFYMDIDLYQYYLGRDDQSVNEQVLKSRIDQQMKVTRMVIAGADLEKIKEKEPKLASYMCRNISIMMAISSIHLLLIGNKEALEKRKKLWEEIKISDPKLYYKLKYASLSGWTDLPGTVGRRLTVGGYRLANAVYRFQ